MKKVLDYVKKLIDDSDQSVSLKALCIIISMLLIIGIVIVSLVTGRPFDSTIFISILGFITTCLGLSLPKFNRDNDKG